MANEHPMDGPRPTCGAETRTCVCSHRRHEHLPERGVCQGCGCTGFLGTPCQRAPRANGRCNRHGGAVPAGAAHPSLKSGTFSRLLKDFDSQRLADFRAAFADQKLTALHAEVAVTETEIRALARTLPDNRPATEAVERRLVNLIDLKRRLVLAVAQREKDLNLMVPFPMFQAALLGLANLVRELAGDDPERLAKVQGRMMAILLPARVDTTIGDQGGK
jgi:hypothetical protein